MKEYRKIFVICRKDGDIEHSDNYCKHGPMGEMEDAIGYGTLLDARKFLTSGDAQAYIDRELPAWTRPLHHPVEVFPWDMLFASPALTWFMLHADAGLPQHLLEPSSGRLLVWRR